jgi:flagellar hook assembly protein FlgD
VSGDDWKGTIKNSAGSVVRTWTWQTEAKDLVWDGRNANNAVVQDGFYDYTVESQDAAGTGQSPDLSAFRLKQAGAQCSCASATRL